MKIVDKLIEANFRRRLNRFAIEVGLGDVEEVYLPNPGRLKELLRPGVRMLLRSRPSNRRQTSYDAIMVKHRGLWVCIDSRIPNRVLREELQSRRLPEFKEYELIQPEYKFGHSRIDFLLKNDRACLLEVKGCTLVRRGMALFPDAPTARGVRHLTELARAAKAGYRACIFFLVQRPDAEYLKPNYQTDPDFGFALRNACASGVEAIAYTSKFEKSHISLQRRIPVLVHASGNRSMKADFPGTTPIRMFSSLYRKN